MPSIKMIYSVAVCHGIKKSSPLWNSAKNNNVRSFVTKVYVLVILIKRIKKIKKEAGQNLSMARSSWPHRRTFTSVTQDQSVVRLRLTITLSAMFDKRPRLFTTSRLMLMARPCMWSSSMQNSQERFYIIRQPGIFSMNNDTFSFCSWP